MHPSGEGRWEGPPSSRPQGDWGGPPSQPSFRGGGAPPPPPPRGGRGGRGRGGGRRGSPSFGRHGDGEHFPHHAAPAGGNVNDGGQYGGGGGDGPFQHRFNVGPHEGAQLSQTDDRWDDAAPPYERSGSGSSRDSPWDGGGERRPHQRPPIDGGGGGGGAGGSAMHRDGNICAFFNLPVGCRKGDACRFQHVKASQEEVRAILRSMPPGPGRGGGGGGGGRGGRH